jgi:dTDP-4-dehydrorhamnose reductase
MRVAVLGASGMLGSMVLEHFMTEPGHEVVATVRLEAARDLVRRHFPHIDCRLLDGETASDDQLASVLDGVAWAVNAVGVIKSYIHDDNRVEVERAIRVNALFPQALARVAERTGTRVLQIATDCVYAGTRGAYVEADAHDPTDVYGKTKSLGEVRAPALHHLRCSIVGPELKSHVSLLDWFRGQPAGATVKGFRNHVWNGVTSLHFARVCAGIMRRDLALPSLQHLVPGDVVDKATLLGHFRTAYDRADVSIVPVDAVVAIDRTIKTTNESLNRDLWSAAGYASPPTIAAMIAELAQARALQS